MSQNIVDFKSQFLGGARANLFRVTGLDEISAQRGFLVKAASIPSSIINPITVPFRGRQLQVAGDRVFEPWVITVINDVNFTIRRRFEEWMKLINQHATNVGVSAPSGYMKQATVEQLGKDGSVLASYSFRDIWPSAVSAIDLSYDAENTIEEFTVEMQVTYWERIK